MYISDQIKYELRHSINITTADIILTQITLNNDTIVSLIALYRLHDYTPQEFVTEFHNLLKKIKNPNLIICGDVNIDLISKSNVKEDYLIKLASHGLAPLITEPTRVTLNSSTCIDHIFIRSSKSGMQWETSLIDLDITDHKMTLLTLTCDEIQRKPSYQLNTYRLDYVLLSKNAKKIKWDEVYSTETVDDGFQKLIDMIRSCIEKSRVTQHQRKKTNKPKKLKPWINNNLLDKINAKNKLYRKTKEQPENLVLLGQYKTEKNALLKVIKKTKDQYYSNLLENNKLNARKQWSIINKLIGTAKKHNEIPTLKMENKNTTTSDPLQVANIFNKHFSTIARELRNKIDIQQSAKINNREFEKMFFLNKCPNTIYLYPTTKAEVTKIINHLDSHKAPGFDNITPLVFKHLLNDVVDPLVYLINFSICSGHFPENLKNAVIKPLYKKDNKTDPYNYRPIALLSICSKILEKVMKIRLSQFLDKNSLISKNQFGFRQNLNTEGALLNFTTKLYDGINSGNCCAAIFVDITKAFDTVDHKLLLNKMHNIGIRGVAYNWFYSYLKDRSHITKICDQHSDPAEIQYGIPQGSVLSGPLFLIYINSLCEGSFKGSLVAFADDIALLYARKNIKDTQDHMEKDLRGLHWWFTTNYMEMSSKTKFIIFNASHHKHEIPDLKYHNINCENIILCKCPTLEQVNSIKYLGLTIDSKLTWKLHIDYIKNKLIKYIRKFYMLQRVCSTQLLKTIYYAVIHSQIGYGLTVWGGTYISTAKPLIVLQKYFIRLILNKSRMEHTAPLFKKLKILPFRNLYVYKTLRVFYDRSSKKNENMNIRKSTLRNNLDVLIPKPNMTLFKKFFSYTAPTFFNILPTHVKQSKNRTSYLKLIRSFLQHENNIESYYTTTQ